MAKAPNLVPARHRLRDVALVCGLDAVKDNAVAPAANEAEILGMRPAERVGRADGLTSFKITPWQIIIVPELLGKHTAGIGHAFEHVDVSQRIASGGQFVVAAFARENWPRATHARAIERRAIVLLAVSIVVVAAPAGALRKLAPENAVDHLKRIEHQRVVRIANSEPDKVKKIAADDIARRMTASAVCELDFESIHVGVRIDCLRVGGGDAHVVARLARDEFAA